MELLRHSGLRSQFGIIWNLRIYFHFPFVHHANYTMPNLFLQVFFVAWSQLKKNLVCLFDSQNEISVLSIALTFPQGFGNQCGHLLSVAQDSTTTSGFSAASLHSSSATSRKLPSIMGTAHIIARERVPLPHVTEQSPQAPTMYLYK